MPGRVLSTEQAKTSIGQVQSIINGGLSEQIANLDNQGKMLSDPNVWDGPLAQTPPWRETAETLTLLMAPSTPYVAEEMWSRLGNPFSVHQQPWPTYDEALTVEETAEVVIQVNGRMRDRLTLAKDAPEDEARAAALASERVQTHLDGKSPVRVIYVPGRLINIVVK